MSHATETKSTSWGGRVVPIAIVVIPLMILILLARSCSSEKPVISGANPTPAATRSSASVAVNPTGASAVSKSYTVEIPKGGTVAVPEKGKDDAYSDPVHIPAGFTICRDADRGLGSFKTQVRNQSVSDAWIDEGPNALGDSEHYQSNGASQNLAYHFVPQGATC